VPTASVLAWLLPAGVLVVAGAGHLRRGPDAVAAFLDSLSLPWRVPVAVLRAQPYLECTIAAGLVASTGAAQVGFALAAVALLSAYAGLVVLALRGDATQGCACFDDGLSPVTGRTFARNVVLVGCTLVAAGGAATGHSPRTLLDPAGWWWLLALAVTGLLAWTMLPDAVASRDVSAQPAGALADRDYVRLPIPMAWLSQGANPADGRVTLRELAARRPQLLVFLSAGCSPCRDVAEQLASWSDRLPELDLVAVQHSPAPDFALTGATVMYDEDVSAARLLGTNGPPAAVLLGADGLLAGGPVHGPAAITAFVADIRAELDAS